MEKDEHYWWLALSFTPGVGRVSFRRLISHFGSPRDVFQAEIGKLLKVEGIGEYAARAIANFNDFSRVEAELRRIEQLGAKLVMLADPHYPENLKSIYDPPPILYVLGEIRQEDKLAIAVVGSRQATEGGLRITEILSSELASFGVTVVSGMARGIDSASHRGALMAGGRTIAVQGCGVDVVYPPEAKKLYNWIMEKGAVVSELPLSTPPEAGNFPARNRIISGLSLGVVIVEASQRSGSLITAKEALEQGREVFAVPGNIFSARSKGTHKLIREGAKLVEGARDILEEILPQLAPREKKTGAEVELKLTPEEERIYQLLGGEPVQIDALIEKSRLEASVVSNLLLSLELAGVVKQLPGKFFKKTL